MNPIPMNHVRCSTCQGIGFTMGAGMIRRDCPDCKGNGFNAVKPEMHMDKMLPRNDNDSHPEPKEVIEESSNTQETNKESLSVEPIQADMIVDAITGELRPKQLSNIEKARAARKRNLDAKRAQNGS